MTVREPGQGVVRGLIVQASFSSLLLGDVNQNTNDDVVVILPEDVLTYNVMNLLGLAARSDVVLEAFAVLQDMLIGLKMQFAGIGGYEF
jgi:hypothetical protein